MTNALEKIAERQHRRNEGREVVCHRCGTQCVLPAGARVDETVCIGCVRRLADRPRPQDRPIAAVRAVAEWSDKRTVGGPGYGVVTCPHCGEKCVVEVGATARSGCGACVRPLGAGPLVREDLAADQSVADAQIAAAEDDDPLPRYVLHVRGEAVTCTAGAMPS